ncbi:Conserved hypothetical protein CHP00255 [Novipirellula aureliae]|uniref:YicC family protein n=2 Tax=Novipirellula aureliae TaxID=2527966 RepID=A0A5C6E7Q3_9BACT|nr:Conserved hypothetical protein CHP00255 [Novipirellula aureliae]
MTGQGHASRSSSQGIIAVEIRTVNNRGFKCILRSPDSLSGFDSRMEGLARSLIHRGSVSMSVSWKRPPSESMPQIDQELLQSYVKQLKAGRDAIGVDVMATIDLAQVAMLPGVIAPAQSDQRDNKLLWQEIEQAVYEAIENLNAMRDQEGSHMAETIRAECDTIESHLEQIGVLAPRSVEVYQNRLESKIKKLLARHEVEYSKIDLLREIQIYADRADVSEEITRLTSHLKMVRGVLGDANTADPHTVDSGEEKAKEGEPTGRKLEFIVQELLRETNTIGSKASDSEIAAFVVEIKCAIERMRELVLNLE